MLLPKLAQFKDKWTYVYTRVYVWRGYFEASPCLLFAGALSRLTTEIERLSLFDLNSMLETLVYRVAKTHRVPYLHRSFSAKEPYN